MAEMFIAKQCQVEPEVNQKQLLKDIKCISMKYFESCKINTSFPFVLIKGLRPAIIGSCYVKIEISFEIKEGLLKWEVRGNTSFREIGCFMFFVLFGLSFTLIPGLLVYLYIGWLILYFLYKNSTYSALEYIWAEIESKYAVSVPLKN